MLLSLRKFVFDNSVFLGLIALQHRGPATPADVSMSYPGHLCISPMNSYVPFNFYTDIAFILFALAIIRASNMVKLFFLLMFAFIPKFSVIKYFFIFPFLLFPLLRMLYVVLRNIVLRCTMSSRFVAISTLSSQHMVFKCFRAWQMHVSNFQLIFSILEVPTTLRIWLLSPRWGAFYVRKYNMGMFYL